jgi:hypothetical protein
MGLAVNFGTKIGRLTAYQYSDFIFKVEIEDKSNNNEVTPAANFSHAEYLIADSNQQVVIRKSLGEGITVVDSKFHIKVDDLEMDFEGSYTHQLIVFDTAGNKLNPVFREPLTVISGYL